MKYRKYLISFRKSNADSFNQNEKEWIKFNETT